MIQSRFFADLLASNQPQMEGFKHWLFHPGMLFNSGESWWGAQKPRPTPHEGLDLCCFEDTSGQVKRLDKDTRIPATFAGEVIKIDSDFLGQSIFLGHDLLAADGRRLCTAYGHTKPFASLQVGRQVAAGELLAVLATRQKARVLPHLHLTLAWIPVPLDPDRLDWRTLSADEGITLIDPLAILTPPA